MLRVCPRLPFPNTANGPSGYPRKILQARLLLRFVGTGAEADACSAEVVLKRISWTSPEALDRAAKRPIEDEQ